jgi:ABC-2 type transport system permease protein
MIGLELFKALRRVRTWTALAGLTVIPLIATVAHKVSHPAAGESGIYGFTEASGLNNAFAALGYMSPFFLVVVIATFAGDSVAGEASWGTLRYLLVRPVSRSRLLWAKVGSVAVLAVLATGVITVVSLLAGTLAFGWHPVRTLFSDLPAATGTLRLLLATLYVAWGTSCIVAVGFFLSTVTDVPAGAIGGAIAVGVASQILDAITALGRLRSGLPTHYWSAWVTLVEPGRGYGDMWRGVALQVPYLMIFGGLAWWWFGRKDILS